MNNRTTLIIITIIVVAMLPFCLALQSPLCFAVFLFGFPVVTFVWGRQTADVQVHLVHREMKGASDG